MKRLEFLLQLQDRLSYLPQDEIEERLSFYNEMIDDRIEEGLSEEEAVAGIGTVEEIAAQILADTPLSKLVKEKMRPKKQLRVWEIVLLAVGSPLWLCLLIAVFAVIFSLYITLWSVVISLWSIFASVAACVPAGVVAGIVLMCKAPGLSGIALLAAGIVCAGLAIFLFYGCKAATKGCIWLTKKIILSIKGCFVKKEDV